MGDKLILTPAGGGLYTVVQDFGEIPAGFATDGASIPRFFWRLIGHPFESDYVDIFVSHDYDYATGRRSRKAADDAMLAALKERGMSWWKRTLIYTAVRMFGGKHYES